jgi:hypothetical protein
VTQIGFCVTAEGRGVEPPRPKPCHCFRNRVPPANEAYLPGRRGSGSNAGEVALGHRLASEHLSSRSTLQCNKRDLIGSRATTRNRPGDLSRTGAALFPLSYGGVASSTGLEPVASAFGGQRSCPSELRRDGTPARTRTRNWRFVFSCDNPFHHQGLAPQTGFDPVASAVTRRRSPD